MSNTPIAPVGRPDAIGHRVILEDLSCHRCAYNLRGLRQDGQCPECGAPIEVSVAGDALRFADPRWVRDLAVGVKCMTPPFAWSVFFGVLVAPGTFLTRFYRRFADVHAVTVMVVVLLLFARCTYGMWRVTRPNPGVGEAESWRSDRLLIRFSLVVAAITAVVLFLNFFMRVGRLAWSPILILGSPTGIIGYIGVYGVANYFGFLAGKVSDEFSRKRARQFLRWYLGGWVCCMVALLFGSVMPGGIVLILWFLGIPIVLIFGALMLTLPFNMARALAEHRKWAEDTWAKADLDLVQQDAVGEIHKSSVEPTQPSD